MSIDKSLKQHYETQAGVKNFLGKQKMVKAPKYWLSKPGHVKAKLAYITDEEEQILIDKNLYGSLRGKPNKGPAGLPSLQGGDYGAGGGGSSGGGGGNGSHDRGGWQHQRAATRPTNIVTVAPKSEPDRQDRARQQAVIEQAIRETKPAMLEDTGGSLPSTFMPGVDIGFQEALRKQKIEEDLKKELDEDFLSEDAKAKAPTTLIPKTVTYERGVPFTDTPIKTTVGQTLYDPRTSQNALLNRGTGIGSVAKRIFGESPLEIALNIGTMGGSKLAKFGKTALDIKQRRGVYGSALGLGEKLTGKKLNLSNLTSTIEKARGRQFDPKDPIGWTGEQKRKKTFHEGKGDGQQVVTGGENIISENIKKFTGITDEDKAEAINRRKIVQGILDQGSYQGKELTGQQRNQLLNYIEYINQFLVDPIPVADGGRIDKALGGRSRDIG